MKHVIIKYPVQITLSRQGNPILLMACVGNEIRQEVEHVQIIVVHTVEMVYFNLLKKNATQV
ncbi:hypothetical protein A3D11_04575 [Candidatus Peribacteria bacterium RIFCSPHIGHO2_02_FULL_49_16]|nr:MAG: hypothetical protein A2880_04140 [Candidatus Peribacteria bacterium RIFCSPHIGHO2_01_FULL_49_38]OGJ58974.1 MAG: hypothetical protein A3D11_04575 [Candidatus Peribacteria bacterium RIFCSPHIGHO2_02_FULL_49_16]